jgi:hypothetical protein
MADPLKVYNPVHRVTHSIVMQWPETKSTKNKTVQNHSSMTISFQVHFTCVIKCQCKLQSSCYLYFLIANQIGNQNTLFSKKKNHTTSHIVTC